MKQAIIVTGDPVDGFTFIGPFADSADAIEWANNEAQLDEWWVAYLHQPERKE